MPTSSPVATLSNREPNILLDRFTARASLNFPESV
jgi:hypothetical protein